MQFRIGTLATLLALSLTGAGCGGDDDSKGDDGDGDDQSVEGEAPVISSFTAQPSTITLGASSVLTWSVSGATTVAINGDNVTGTTLVVSPTVTTAYTLTATADFAASTATTTVTVDANADSTPAEPIAYTKNQFFSIDSGTTDWLIVPNSYDDTHQTPTRLLVWLHGCGGESQYEVGWLSPADETQTWITLSPGGAEGECWNMETVTNIVLNSIVELKTHFNIAPKQVIIGGYSSGGDAAYRIAFYNASQFAGVLAENTSPFRDTGSSQASSLAAATWKFNVVHLAHNQDDSYPVADVEAEVNAMVDAGFPVTFIKKDGSHYDDSGTVDDARAYLMPYITAGWTAP